MPCSNQHTRTHCHTVSNGQGFLRPSCLLLVTAPYMEACGPRCMIAHHLVAEATQLCTTATANQILSFLVCGRMAAPHGLATLHPPSFSMCTLSAALSRMPARTHARRNSEADRDRASIPNNQNLLAAAAESLCYSVGGNFNGRLLAHTVLPPGSDTPSYMDNGTGNTPRSGEDAMLKERRGGGGGGGGGAGPGGVGGRGGGGGAYSDAQKRGMLSGVSGSCMTHITEASENEVNNSMNSVTFSRLESLHTTVTSVSSTHSQDAVERELFLM